jgi:hypothetical protein
MPSHLSTIGFDVPTQESLVRLLEQLLPASTRIKARGGHYRLWRGRSGEEMWIQLDRAGDVVGVAPHFTGSCSVHARVASRVTRQGDTALDGAFHCWMSPDGSAEGESYPFVFDCPDSGTYGKLRLPLVVDVQLAAFAHDVSLHASSQAFDESQAQDKVRFALQSFIPSGLFVPNESASDPPGFLRDVVPPEATAIFTGQVVEGETNVNAFTGRSFHWAAVDTLSARVDVVIDPALVAAAPMAGNVISGSFWLTGRVPPLAMSRGNWLSKLKVWG